MEFRNTKEAIEYLKSLEDIIMPPQFTYFNHCTVYQSKSLKNPRYQSWTELPLGEVILNKEMSFKDRNMRITQALEKGSLEDAEIYYAKLDNSKNFMLRVIIPNANLSIDDKTELGIDEVYQTKLIQEHRGFGTDPHPKLKTGEKLLVFASSTVDEISGKKIDVFYAIREQDAIMYAKKVASELEKQSKYSTAILPTSSIYDGTYDFDKHTYAIKKSKDFSRYTETKIIGDSENGPIYGTEFTRDYIYEVQQEMLKKKKKDKQKLENSLGITIIDYYTVIVGDKLVNLPKSKDELLNEYLMMNYQIDHSYYSKSSNFSDVYRQEMKKILKEVYDDMIKKVEDNVKVSPLKPDEPVNTSTPPQAIPIKERVIHPSGPKEPSEIPKKETEDNLVHRAVQNHNLDRLYKQKQELIEQKEELIKKSVTKSSPEPQYDEYGVEISRINEETQRFQQTEQIHDVGRKR